MTKTSIPSINDLTHERSNNNTFLIESDFNAIMEHTRMLEHFYPDKVIQIGCCQQAGTFYISANCKDFWGISAKQMRFLSIEQYLELVHPDDIACLLKVRQFIEKNEGAVDPTQTRFSVTYRMKDPEGEYQTIENEKLVLKTKTGSLIHFCTYTKHAQKTNSVLLDIYQLINNKKTKVKSLVFKEGDHSLSPREIDIIRLIDKGYNNSQISHLLSLSIFTVKNHKQRLFKKTQVNTTIELLRFARNNNIV